MKKLKGLPISHGDKYIEIADAKREPQKTTLLSIAGKINACYTDFHRLAGKGELFEILALSVNQDEKAALLGCYNSRTKAGNSLLKQIKLNQETIYQSVCPYCGILHSTTFDHYIPKDSFPEFSIFALNLLPCCDTCNRKKAEYWRDADSCGIIHFYYDEIPEEKFLFCKLEHNGSAVPAISYSLDFPISVDHECIKIIERHYDRLNLLERFNEHASIFLSERIKTIKTYFSGTEVELKIALTNDARQLADVYGKNNYKAALMEALSDDDDFSSEILIDSRS